HSSTRNSIFPTDGELLMANTYRAHPRHRTDEQQETMASSKLNHRRTKDLPPGSSLAHPETV
ncbi:hypothetical protein, partial [Acinetobacter baumannii]|uniref:hypothetical protein n=1 Tax=Acinetobacter baumannii TaxID=470 RepID=UPI001C07D926